MPTRGDFQVWTFNEFLGSDQGGINTDFAFMGELSSIKKFNVVPQSYRSGYIQYNVSHVSSNSHEILINGRALPPVAIHKPPGESKAVLTYMDLIPRDYFTEGENTVQFKRNGSDNFLIHIAAVHWREQY